MILTKEVKIKLNAQNIKHYRDLGYICNPHDEILIKVEHLSNGSNYKVKVKCDKCENIKELIYNKYIKNISNGGYYSCSNKCSVEKSEEKCLEKYGKKSYTKTNECKEKIKRTKKEKYDNENYNNKEKIKEINLKLYGYENVFQNNDIKEKIKKTKKEKYNDEFFTNREKSKKTCLDRYEVESYTQTQEYKKYMKSLTFDYNIIQEKFKKTCLKRYGVEYPAQNIDIFNKTQKSQLKIKYYKNIRYQGTYELDFLIFCDSIGLLNELTKIYSFNYLYQNKNKIYHPDFYIKKLNLIIEIKSSYYYNLYIEKNICKQNCCIDKNYNFLFIIDKNYDNFIKKLGELNNLNPLIININF
jgi:hypothetical protein